MSRNVTSAAASDLPDASAWPSGLSGSPEAFSITPRPEPLEEHVFSWARRAPRSARRHWLRTGTDAGAGCRRREWCAPSIRPAFPAPVRKAAGREAPIVVDLFSPARRTASSSAASSSMVQARRSLNTWFAMLAAAALVKVMQRMRAGSPRDSSRRMTRWAGTWVLPEPALAATHADAGVEDAGLPLDDNRRDFARLAHSPSRLVGGAGPATTPEREPDGRR